MKLLDFGVLELYAAEFILAQVETLNAVICSNVELSESVVGQAELFEVRVVAVLEICDPVVTEFCTFQVCQVGYID